MIRGMEQYLESRNHGKVAYLPRGELRMCGPLDAYVLAGFFMKRYEGKPEFEESFFKIV
jgi:hypothetical protein